jgi:hypothetical protein
VFTDLFKERNAFIFCDSRSMKKRNITPWRWRRNDAVKSPQLFAQWSNVTSRNIGNVDYTAVLTLKRTLTWRWFIKVSVSQFLRQIPRLYPISARIHLRIRGQCFPKSAADGVLLASKNSHGFSHPCSRKYSARMSFFFHGTTPPVGQGLLIIEASRFHSDTPHSVGLLRTSDQPDAETSKWQQITLTRDRHPCLRRDSNPQSQHMNGGTPTDLHRAATGIACPDDRHPWLRICVSDPILDRHYCIPAAYVTTHCVIWP